MTYSNAIHSTISNQPKATKFSNLESKASSKNEMGDAALEAIHFDLGQVVLTKGVAHLLSDLPHDVLMPFLVRHKNADWGDVCEEDKVSNDEATHYGFRVLSSYEFCARTIWIITEADRSATTILLPSEWGSMPEPPFFLI